MTRNELRDGLAVVVNWPNDDAEEARIVKAGNRLELWFETKEGEVLNIMPEINDRLLAILEPHATMSIGYPVNCLSQPSPETLERFWISLT